MAIGGLLAGLVLGLLVGFLRDRLDVHWRTDADVEEALGIPVIALLPTVSGRDRKAVPS